MKLEIKTDNNYSSKSFLPLFLGLVIFSLIVVMTNISLKLGNISKHYEINFLCRVLAIDKSSFNFNKLSRLLKITSKQKIWELCKEIVK